MVQRAVDHVLRVQVQLLDGLPLDVGATGATEDVDEPRLVHLA